MRAYLNYDIQVSKPGINDLRLVPADFLDQLRALVPKPGTDYAKFVSVVVKPGKAIRDHKHEGNWTALYYVDPADTPITIEGEPYLPEKGEVVVLKPGQVHGVLENESDCLRVSIAMLVEE